MWCIKDERATMASQKLLQVLNCTNARVYSKAFEYQYRAGRQDENPKLHGKSYPGEDCCDLHPGPDHAVNYCGGTHIFR